MFVLRQYWQKLATKLWLRPTLSGLFAVTMAALAYWLGQRYDDVFSFDISEDSLLMLLGIFTSSMLSVATFTVSAIVTAASSASNSTTPRASQYVLNDNISQLVLSAFIGAFIYSLVGVFSLKTLHYGPTGRFVLFVGLLVFVLLVLFALINWIDHAIKLGRQGTIVGKLYDATVATLRPEIVGTFGAKTWQGGIPLQGQAVYPMKVGYVTAIHIQALQQAAERSDTQIIISTRPGEVAETTTPIAYITPASNADEALLTCIHNALVIDSKRQPFMDLRHNLLNLTETADRALSPGINDPGTAIHIMNIQMDLLLQWANARALPQCTEVQYDRLSLPSITAEELVNDCFTPIARDGAGTIEVGIRLQKVLQVLVRAGQPELTLAAKNMSATALELAEQRLVANEHKAKIAKVASAV